MITKDDRNRARKHRHLRVRKRITGTEVRPRLNVYRSNKHIYAQVINDANGTTLVAASTLDPELKGEVQNGATVEAARKVGALVAKRAVDKGLTAVVFDRGGYLYHGRVQALADGAREGGLEF